jgi:hypothetical protein
MASLCNWLIMVLEQFLHDELMIDESRLVMCTNIKLRHTFSTLLLFTYIF